MFLLNFLCFWLALFCFSHLKYTQLFIVVKKKFIKSLLAFVILNIQFELK